MERSDGWIFWNRNPTPAPERLATGHSIRIWKHTVGRREWEREEQQPAPSELPSSGLSSHKLFEARRVFRGACEMSLDIVQDPRLRVQELVETFALAQSFDTTLRADVPDILAEASDGVSSAELSRRTGINEKKLGRGNSVYLIPPRR